MGFQKLKKRPDFLRVAKKGHCFSSSFFLLQVLRNAKKREGEAVSTFRLGVTASKKVGNAVARNFAKRRMRVVLHTVLRRHAADYFSSSFDYDIVMIAKKKLVGCDFDRLEQDLIRKIQK